MGVYVFSITGFFGEENFKLKWIKALTHKGKLISLTTMPRCLLLWIFNMASCFAPWVQKTIWYLVFNDSSKLELFSLANENFDYWKQGFREWYGLGFTWEVWEKRREKPPNPDFCGAPVLWVRLIEAGFQFALCQYISIPWSCSLIQITLLKKSNIRTTPIPKSNTEKWNANKREEVSGLLTMCRVSQSQFTAILG